MKLSLQYQRDTAGNPFSVQLPFAEWQKLMAKMTKYEQALSIKSDLQQAYEEVALMRKAKARPETLTDFLDGL